MRCDTSSRPVKKPACAGGPEGDSYQRVIQRNGNRSVSGLGRVEPERAAAIAGDLGDIEKYLSHGAVMDHEAAMDLGLNVDYLPPDNVLWDAIWRLYCDYVLALARGGIGQIFESRGASVY